MTTDTEAVSGDLIETPNGNRYIVLPNGMLAYVGNKHLHKSEGLVSRTGVDCKILGRCTLVPYLDPHDENDFDSDWNLLRRRESFPIPLPKGCTCGHDALMGVLSCNVHEVRIRREEDPLLDIAKRL